MPEQVDAYRHGSQRRRNSPTEQTGDLMPDQDRAPVDYSPPIRERSGPVLSWHRDADLDAITTGATPLYITEKIHPSAFVEQLRSLAPAPMFGDFNNLPRNAEYQWYEHEGNWQNRLIHGPSLEVMASLLEKEGMAGMVQMVYMDPPYGISFKSNMQLDTQSRNVSENAKGLPSDPQQIQAFRDTYQNGIHSYLDNLYRNFVHARELLSESGSIFVQIGSENVNRVALVMDEVFGSENKVALIPFAKGGTRTAKLLPQSSDYLLWYAKDIDHMTYHQLYEPLDRAEMIKHMSSYAMVETDQGTRQLTAEERQHPDLLPDDAHLYRRTPLSSSGLSTTGRSEPFEYQGETYRPPPGGMWSVSHEGLQHLADIGRLDAVVGGALSWKWYEDEIPGRQINNLWAIPMRVADLHYAVETSTSVIERCLQMATDPGDLIIDLTGGGGVTPFAAERWGRRWISIDVSRIAIAISRQRMLTATYDWFKIAADPVDGEAVRDPVHGFIYETCDRVTARSLAYDDPQPPIQLVNRPKKTSRTIRVSSPFTVESHSPWRYTDPAAAVGESEATIRGHESLLEAIQIAGIRTPDQGQLEIEQLETHDQRSPITHRCKSALEGEQTKETALVILPADQTCSETLIKRLAREAGQIDVERLIIVAFAFDPIASGQGPEQLGKIEVLKVMANRDLQIPGLKNKDADDSFIVIGRPDIDINKVDGTRIEVIIRGYDTFDHRTGAIRSGDADEIDCWMIDTEYNEIEFIARRIHLPSSRTDKRIQRFRRQLGKLIDPSLWESMQSTKSAPFEIPKRDQPRIAVRIITRTGIEMTVERDVSEFAE